MDVDVDFWIWGKPKILQIADQIILTANCHFTFLDEVRNVLRVSCSNLEAGCIYSLWSNSGVLVSNAFNLDNLPVVSYWLLCLGSSYLGMLFILLYLAGCSSHCNLHCVETAARCLFLVLVELFYILDLLTAFRCTWGVLYFLVTMSFEVVSLVWGEGSLDAQL